jgi:hypothetical protein
LRIAAWVVTVWVAWRWLGFFAGLVRIRSFEKGPSRREARRTVINRGAFNAFFSVAAAYLWAVVYKLDFTEPFVGFLSAVMMCSLAVGIASAFMQPEKRDPRTLEICRLRPLPKG